MAVWKNEDMFFGRKTNLSGKNMKWLQWAMLCFALLTTHWFFFW